MTLPKFLIGMAAVTLVVAIWSYFDSASAGVVAMRALASAVILQLGYFLIVFAMVLASPKPVQQAKSQGGKEPDELPKRPSSVPSARSPG